MLWHSRNCYCCTFMCISSCFFFFFQAEDGIRDIGVTGVQTCALPILGIGPVVSSAMVAAIGDGAAFVKARDFGAWLGLVPKQVSTGDRTLLLGISKRGNRYLRTMFVQGARSVLLRRATWANHSFGRWLEAAAPRLHRNVLAVALAHKLARIAWSVLTREGGYTRTPDARPA